MLSEFGLPPMSSGAITQPHLALRLLSPSVSLLDSDVPRNELLAECLLLASRSEPPDQATRMIERAFVLLRFDEDNIAKSMRRLTTLEHCIGGDLGVEQASQVDCL